MEAIIKNVVSRTKFFGDIMDHERWRAGNFMTYLAELSWYPVSGAHIDEFVDDYARCCTILLKVGFGLEPECIVSEALPRKYRGSKIESPLKKLYSNQIEFYQMLANTRSNTFREAVQRSFRDSTEYELYIKSIISDLATCVTEIYRSAPAAGDFEACVVLAAQQVVQKEIQHFFSPHTKG